MTWTEMVRVLCYVLASPALASTGINTREYRVLGTPFVVSATVGVLWIVVGVFHHLWEQRHVEDPESGLE